MIEELFIVAGLGAAVAVTIQEASSLLVYSHIIIVQAEVVCRSTVAVHAICNMDMNSLLFASLLRISRMVMNL